MPEKLKSYKLQATSYKLNMVVKKTIKKKVLVSKKQTTRAKKPTVKRTSPKKKVTTRKRTSTKAQKRMISATLEKCFWVHNGPAIMNLEELRDVLRNIISDEQFAYHNDGESDFARWVDEVLGDSLCAQALSRVKTRNGAAVVVTRYLREYK